MATISSLKGSDNKSPSPFQRTVDDGPPPSSTKPKKVEGSLFSQSTNSIGAANSAGLGPEGGSPQVLASQYLASILTGIKGLSSLFPGIVPLLSDLTGRLVTAVPQLANDFAQSGGMGGGLVPVGGMPTPQPPPMPSPMAPPGGAMPPPMGGPAMPMPPMPPPGGMGPM